MKTKLSFTLLTLILCFFSTSAQVSVSEYFFNGGTLVDNQDPSNTLVQIGSLLNTVTDRDGFSGNALALNGDVLQATTGAKREDYSIAFWMKTSTNDADQRIILDQYGGTGTIGYQFYLENGSLVAKARFSYTNNTNRVSSLASLTKTTISDNAWHHVVLTMSTNFRATNNGNIPNTTYRLYVDNVLEQSQNIEIATTQSGADDFRTINDVPLSIGSSQDMSASKYEDELDDIRLYGSLLADTQVADIFNQRTSKTTIHVKNDATGNNDGSTWTDAFTSLKAATDNATAIGDEIWVASGMYKPDASNRSVYFTLQQGVKLYGGFDGTETELNERDWVNNRTILSGDLMGNDDAAITYTNTLRSDNSYRILYVESDDVLIDGVTITAGQANNTANNEFNRGAAIYKNQTAKIFTIRNSIISNNVSNREGNVHAPFSGAGNKLTIENCIINGNFARYGGGFSSTLVGSGFLETKVYNSLFFDNIAGDVAVGDGFSGSSLFFAANDGQIDLTIINSTFTENEDLGTSGSNDKGTIAVRRLNNDATSVANVTLHNNIFYNNLLSPTTVNSRVIGFMNRPSNKLNNLIATHNIANSTDLISRATVSTVSDIVEQDPMFTDAASQDYTLANGSPAIDAGSNAAIPDDLVGDILGNRRVHNTEADMGAYEAGSVLRNDVAPTMLVQNISVELGNTGEVTITASQLDNGTTDDDTPANELIFTLDKSTFGCANVGDNTVIVSVQDASRNKSTAEAIVTVTSSINDEAVSIAEESACSDASSTVSTASSVSGINYSLRNSSDNSIIDGPIPGTGSGLDFSTGTISENTTFNVFAEIPPVTNISGGLDFDGVNDKVATSYTFTTTNTFTIEAWIYPRATSWNRLITTVNEIGSSAGDFLIDTFGATNNGKNVRFILDGEVSGGDVSLTANQVLTLNAWNHIAVTFDNGAAKIYVDGSEVASTVVSSNRIIQTGRPVFLGEQNVTAGAFFDGKMDEVSIWYTAKTVTEIAENMNKCRGGTEAGLQAYFNFEQSEGSVLTEIVGEKNGTLINFDETTAWTDGQELSCSVGCGFQMTDEVTLNIGDDTPPMVVAKDTIVYLDSTGTGTLTVEDVYSSASDNCTAEEDVDLSIDKELFFNVNIGENTVVLTATDASGNEATAEATVTVRDTLAPVVTTQNLTVQITDGTATIVASQINNGSRDNSTASEDLIYSIDKDQFACTDLGENTVTLTVADASGNESMATAIVTVEESTLPIAVGKNVSIMLDENGTVTLDPSSVDDGSSDNCTVNSELVFGLSQSTFSCDDLGINTITFEVIDASGNTGEATIEVTVTDEIDPIVVAQDISVELDDNDQVTITPEQLDNGSSDNCSITLSLDKTSFARADLGENTVTFTATDAAGNTASATAKVTVEESKTPQTISFTLQETATYGDAPITLAATASSGLTVAYSVAGAGELINGNELKINGAGDITLTASQAGDDSFSSAAEIAETISITKANLTATAEDLTTTFGSSQSLNFSVTYSGFVGDDNSMDIDQVPTTGSAGSAISNAGTYAIIVSNGLDNDYSFSYIEGTLTIDKADQTIIFPTLSDVDVANTNSLFLSANADSSLPVNYTITEGADIASILGLEVNISGVGTVTIEANQEGSNNYNPAPAIQQSFEVTDSRKQEQSISLTDVDNVVYGDSPISLTATASSGLAVTYTYVDGPATLSGNVVSITGAGTVNIEVSQEGDASFNPATAVTQSIVVAKAAVIITPDDQQIEIGEALPSFTYSFSGLVNGDDESMIDTLPLIESPTADPNIEGTYPIAVIQDAVDANYVFSNENGVLTVVRPLGLLDQTFKIYPNPVAEYIMIKTNELVDLRFYGLNGQLIKEITQVNGKVDVTDLKSGTYLMEVSNSKERTTVRINKKY